MSLRQISVLRLRTGPWEPASVIQGHSASMEKEKPRVSPKVSQRKDSTPERGTPTHKGLRRGQPGWAGGCLTGAQGKGMKLALWPRC